jgi:hypothetical protein
VRRVALTAPAVSSSSSAADDDDIVGVQPRAQDNEDDQVIVNIGRNLTIA